MREEQRSQPGAPTARTVRRGVERGCIAGRMQPEFHHGLLGNVNRRVLVTTEEAENTEGISRKT